MRYTAYCSAVAALTITPLWYWHSGYSIPSCLLISTGIGALLLFLKVVARPLFRLKFSRLRHLPGPESRSLLMGNISAVFDDTPALSVSNWVSDIPNDGLIHFHGLLGSDYVIVTRPQGFAEVMIKHPYRFEKTTGMRRYVQRFLGDGIIIDAGSKHIKDRKLLRSSFQPRQINDIKSFILSRCQLLTQCMIDEALLSFGGKNVTSFNVSVDDWLSRLALDVAFAFALGVDFKVVSDRNSEVFAAYRRSFACDADKRRHYMWHNAFPSWLASRLVGDLDAELDGAYQTLRGIVHSTVLQRQSQLCTRERVYEHDILSLLIAAGDFTTKANVEQIMLMIAAGHESTATTMTWVLIELALAPELQNWLREEIMAFETDGSAAKAQLDSLPRLNAICCETVRLHPAIALTVRKSVCDTVIEGEMIPAGTYVLLPCQAINRSSFSWGVDALHFVPDRWIRHEDGIEKVDSLGGAQSSFCVETFLHGPRGCLGQGLAMAQIKRATAAIVSRFRIESPTGERPETTGFITSRPKNAELRLVPLR